jgi:hypothetical protein
VIGPVHEEDSEDRGVERFFPGDHIRIQHGALRIRFLVGATVVLEGPADLSLANM